MVTLEKMVLNVVWQTSACLWWNCDCSYRWMNLHVFIRAVIKVLSGSLGHYCSVKTFQQKYWNCMAEKLVKMESETVACSHLSSVPRYSYMCWAELTLHQEGAVKILTICVRWVRFNCFPCDSISELLGNILTFHILQPGTHCTDTLSSPLCSI